MVLKKELEERVAMLEEQVAMYERNQERMKKKEKASKMKVCEKLKPKAVRLERESSDHQMPDEGGETKSI